MAVIVLFTNQVLVRPSAVCHPSDVPQMLCPTLVGRRAEREALAVLLDSGGGGCAAVLGEAGLGKSRLLRELAGTARERGLRVLQGRAVPGRRRTPYRPLAEALVTACRRFGPPASPDLIPYRPALGRLIPEWHRPELAASPESTVILAEGVLRMLRALSGAAGALLVIEDVHWADPDTLAVLEYLADHAAEEHLACVLSGRPEPGPGLDTVRAVTGRHAAALIELPALTAVEVAEMGRRCLGTPDPPEGLDELLARAEGVPLRVEELLAAAVEAGALVGRPGGWTVSAAAAQVVPRTLTDAGAQRLAALDPADRETLETAALLGRRIDVSLLARVLGRAPAAVLEALRRCAAPRLLTRDAGGYQFRHALTRDAVLALLPREIRAALAGRARAAVEAAYPGLPGRWGELAAELSIAAGDLADAAGCLLAVGRRALEGGALPTARHVLDQAGELVRDEPGLAVAVDELRTEIAAQAGDVDTAFAIGLGLVDRVPDRARRAEVHLWLAEAAAAAARWEAAHEQLAAARRLVAGECLIARIDALDAHVLMGGARLEDAETHARRALAAAERIGLADAACRALEVLGRLARTRDVAEAEAAFTRQREIAAAHGLTLWVVRAAHELGTVDLVRANDPHRLRSARNLAVEAGALATVATLDLQLAASGFLALDASGCLDAALRCQGAARRWNLGLVLAEALLLEAGAHAIAGRRDDMERAITRARAVGRTEPELEAVACGRRAMFALLRERRDQALELCERAVSIERGAPAVYPRAYWFTWALLRTVQDVDGERARAAVRVAIPADSPFAQATLDYANAVAAGRRGDRDEATELAAAARAKMRPPGLAGQRHLAERLVAECGLADGWGDPVRWLQEAAAYFLASGHDHVERACRSLLHKAGVPLPRREHGHRSVPPALAALGITDREADVLALVAEGLTSREIGQRLFISVRTVDKHVERLLAKTGTSRRAELREFGT